MSDFILHIESSSTICSVALSDGQKLLDYFNAQETNVHSELLTVFISNLLVKNKLAIHDLKAISVSKGPGSFTGLRIGVSVAKGICFGTGIPLIGINTLEAMAGARISENRNTCIVMDARNGQVYYGLFDPEGAALIPVRVGSFEENDLLEILASYPTLVCGVGVKKWAGKISNPHVEKEDNFYPDARYLVPKAWQRYAGSEFENLAAFEPYYIKDFIAKKGKKVSNILNR